MTALTGKTQEKQLWYQKSMTMKSPGSEPWSSPSFLSFSWSSLFLSLSVIASKLSKNTSVPSYSDLAVLRKEEPQVLACFSSYPVLTSIPAWTWELSPMKFHRKKCYQEIQWQSVWMLYVSTRWICCIAQHTHPPDSISQARRGNIQYKYLMQYQPQLVC